jgi:hypothetical protein
MSFVRDSHSSRDYHKGTGSRVFPHRKPGSLQYFPWVFQLPPTYLLKGLSSTYPHFNDHYSDTKWTNRDVNTLFSRRCSSVFSLFLPSLSIIPGHCSSITLMHIYTCCCSCMSMHHGFGMNPQIKHMGHSSTFMHVHYVLSHFNKLTFASLLFHALQTSMFHSFLGIFTLGALMGFAILMWCSPVVWCVTWNVRSSIVFQILRFEGIKRSDETMNC